VSLFNNIKKILLGNGAAQLIQFAFLPLSAFLYTPEQFGVFGTIQAYSTVLTIFISLQLYVAIPFEKNQIELYNLKNLNFKYIIFTTIFLLIIYGLLNIDYFSILVIFLASITAVTNTLRSLIVYSGNFTRLSTSYVIRALVIVISQAALSFSNTINGLIYGLLLGEVIYSVLLHYFIKRSIDLPSLNVRSFFKVSTIDIFTKYRAFSLYGSILELTSVLIFYGPIFIFS
jgi:O-antigen/teichoic acid export membrane protein